jgi:uncharacterized protein YacL
MVLHILRAVFVLLMAAVGYFYLQLSWLTMTIALTLGVVFVCIDILSPRRKLAIFAGTFFGLIVGVVFAYALSFAVRLIVEQTNQLLPQPLLFPDRWVAFFNLMIGTTCCYLAVSFILQTKDDFRFIIPYVEFSKQVKGARPILLDTSVLIDGRIADIAATGMLESQLIVPRFVLEEMQLIADQGDALKRARGRRGLDVLTKLRGIPRVDVILYESGRQSDEDVPVDQKLMELALELSARVLSNDYNLGKVAQLRGVDVINVNDLASALRPVIVPGERLRVRILRAGEEAGQGVGYLEDGTMVVVEQARQRLNEDVEVTVSRALQTSAGRMIFGRVSSDVLSEVTTTPPRRP